MIRGMKKVLLSTLAASFILLLFLIFVTPVEAAAIIDRPSTTSCSGQYDLNENTYIRENDDEFSVKKISDGSKIIIPKTRNTYVGWIFSKVLITHTNYVTSLEIELDQSGATMSIVQSGLSGSQEICNDPIDYTRASSETEDVAPDPVAPDTSSPSTDDSNKDVYEGYEGTDKGNLVSQSWQTNFSGQNCSTYGCWISLVWNWAMLILVPLSVLVLSAAGVLYMTSEGDSNRVGLAKKLIIGVVSGVAILVLSKVLLTIIGVDGQSWNIQQNPETTEEPVDGSGGSFTPGGGDGGGGGGGGAD